MFLPQRPRSVVHAIGPEEAEALAEIHAEGFERGWSAEELAALVGDPAVITFVLRRHSMFWPPRLGGFVLVRTVADEAEVLSIVVRPLFQGRGCGRMLMEEVLRRLYRDRVANCFLEVDRDNRAAVHLYESLGFKTVGERKGYYHRLDAPAGVALVMRPSLR